MRSQIPERFPWLRCRPGDSFFVPSLDPYRTAMDGVSAAVSQMGPYSRYRYRVGIYKGHLGVLFTFPAKRQ